jgi:type IV secretion system protein TrbI
VALNLPSFQKGQTPDEFHNVDRKQTAEGLSELPRSYGDLKKPPPKLRPPLPGDVGPPVVDMERDLGVAQPATPAFRPNAEDDAVRAERLRLARQVRESGVFFQISAREQTAQAKAGQGTAPAVPEHTPQSNTRGLRLDPERDQNYQGRKLEFLNQKADADAHNPHPLQNPLSPYQVMAGTMIPAGLVTGINSDLPGWSLPRSPRTSTTRRQGATSWSRSP